MLVFRNLGWSQVVHLLSKHSKEEKKLSQLSAKEAKIKATFENLGKGDVISSKNFSLVVIRQINARAVIGMICTSCKKRHVNQVFKETFAWSDEKKAVVGNDGEVAEWWSPDLQVVHEDDLILADESAEFPVDDDYSSLSKEQGATLCDNNKELLIHCAKILAACDSRKASLRRVLTLIGVPLTDETAELLFAILALDNEINRQSSARRILGVILAATMADSDTQQSTKH